MPWSYRNPMEKPSFLKGGGNPYRVFVESMKEGAATLDPEGTILYCNNCFAEMVKSY